MAGFPVWRRFPAYRKSYPLEVFFFRGIFVLWGEVLNGNAKIKESAGNLSVGVGGFQKMADRVFDRSKPVSGQIEVPDRSPGKSEVPNKGQPCWVRGLFASSLGSVGRILGFLGPGFEQSCRILHDFFQLDRPVHVIGQQVLVLLVIDAVFLENGDIGIHRTVLHDRVGDVGTGFPVAVELRFGKTDVCQELGHFFLVQERLGTVVVASGWNKERDNQGGNRQETGKVSGHIV